MLDKYTKGKPYLLHTFTGKYDQFGFKCFSLEFINNGKAVDRLYVISGSPTAQRRQLPHPKEDYSKSGNPLPEGIYKVGEIIQLSSPEKGVGCIKIPLDVLSDFRVNNRSEFLIHEDFLRSYGGAIGSLGCIVTYTKADMDRIVSWCSQKSRPNILVANYGLGLLTKHNILV